MAESAQPVSTVARTILAFKEEANTAKHSRMAQNQENYHCFNLEQNFTGKKDGQSREFLPKQSTAMEQLSSFMSQGLITNDEWFEVRDQNGVQRDEKSEVTSKDMQKILARQFEKADMPTFVADSLKSGFLGSLMISKVGGRHDSILTGISVEESFDEETGLNKKVLSRQIKDVWCLDLNVVRQEDYYPDPTGRGLYEIESIEMDYHELLEMAEEKPKIYDRNAILNYKFVDEETDQKHKKSVETGQNTVQSSIRKIVKLYEFWGTLIDPETGEVIKKNCHSAITHDGVVIIPPRDNPFWHRESPYVVSPILRVPKSVWHKAIADAPTKLNFAQNEVFNLMLDSGLMSVHGIKQIREDWLEDPSQVENGIAPGTTLRANSNTPPNAKVLERVDTSDPNTDTTNIYNLIEREHNQSALTNDIRMGGLPQRNVKATEIVASTQAINTILTGMTGMIENKWALKVISKSALVTAQNLNDYDLNEVRNLLGPQKAILLAGKDAGEIFRDFAIGRKFKVFGLTKTLNKVNDFRKFTTLLQVIGTSPRLSDEFARQFSFTKLLSEIMDSLDIDSDKIKADEEEKARAAQIEAARMQNEANQAAGQVGGGQNEEAQPGQAPSAANTSTEGDVQIPRAALSGGV